jgi:hypothetical protein
VRPQYWLPLLALAACRPAAHAKRPAPPALDTAAVSRLWKAPKDSANDRLLGTPRVISKPTVVVFWLRASDSLSRDSAQAASRDLDFYTEQVATTLADNGIGLVATKADTVYVEQADHHHRAIVLSGLDYPYGYLLIDPGTPERILTGVYNDADLMDELHAYFDLPDNSDSSQTVPRVIT